jgi:ubiquinone/menaquinone biosynthesis C-methylase UbiE
MDKVGRLAIVRDIAERYDTVWSARFEAVARQIGVLVPARIGDKVLHIGTGTGIVARILTEVAPKVGLMVACDRKERRSDWRRSAFGPVNWS